MNTVYTVGLNYVLLCARLFKHLPTYLDLNPGRWLKWDPMTHSTDITWVLVRKADFQASSQTQWVRIWILTRFPRWFSSTVKLENGSFTGFCPAVLRSAPQVGHLTHWGALLIWNPRIHQNRWFKSGVSQGMCIFLKKTLPLGDSDDQPDLEIQLTI